MSGWQLMLTRTLSFRHQLFIKLFASAGCHAVCLESPLCPPWLSKPVGMPSLLVLACYKALSPKLGSYPSLPGIIGECHLHNMPHPLKYIRGAKVMAWDLWHRRTGLGRGRCIGVEACWTAPCVSVSRIIGKWLLRRVSCYFSILLLTACRDCVQEYVPQCLLTA